MSSFCNIIKIRTTTGTLHYYQVCSNETIKDLNNYLSEIYQNEEPLKFTYKGVDVNDNQLLSEYIGKTENLCCIVPIRRSILTRKKSIKPQQHGFNLTPDPREIDLPPRPELQNDTPIK